MLSRNPFFAISFIHKRYLILVIKSNNLKTVPEQAQSEGKLMADSRNEGKLGAGESGKQIKERREAQG
jgi:hypothetical protein